MAWVCCAGFLTVALVRIAYGAGGSNVTPVTIASPNGKIKIEIRTDTAGQLTWSVQRQDQTILAAAPLGLTVDGHNLGQSATLGEPRTRTINEQYPTWGNHAVAVNHCNEAVIPVQCADGVKYKLEVRAFDDGAAVRTRVTLDDTAHTIAGEVTSWALPSDSYVWWARYDGSYERPCQSGTLETLPVNNPLAPPITFKLGESLYVSLTEANNDCFPDMGLVRDGAFIKAVFPASSDGWSQQGSIVTPWRVAIIAEGLNALVNSDIVTNLCPSPPAELASADWIRPGRSLWQWWSIGAPRLNDQKEWIDAAKKLGFEYYLIDEGWRNWRSPGKDQWQCLKEVIDYAKTQGIGSLVWVNSSEMRTDAERRAYLEKVAALGAVGIKIDFIPACTAEITRWYEGALRDTADLHLLCNFHGAVKPTGRRRTWPHELTREAVRGHEYHMTRYHRVQAADHDETVLFTRFLAGPADYTPTAFDLREMVGYTWAHLLAQAVDMTSPLLHFAGKYQDFIGNPAEDLMRHLPSTWDETIVLPGTEIGKTVGFARRRGQAWTIGVLNGGAAATFPIDLSFLGTGAWQAEVFGDDPDNPAVFNRESKAVTAGDQLTTSMSPRGGAVVWITKSASTGLDGNGHLKAIEAKTDGFSFTRLKNGLQLHTGDTVKNVIFYGPSTVRVNENLGRNFWKYPSIVVVGKPAAIPFSVKETGDSLTIVSDKLQIKADKKTGALMFMDATGKTLTQERTENHAAIKQVEISGAPTYEVSNSFTLKPDEGWYGFGYVDSAPAKTNRRGQELLLIQTNLGIVIPMIVSSERYGIMWDTYSIMKFKDDASGATLWAESAPGGVDYYFFAGDTMDDVIAGYRDLTGASPMYPKQALGLFMSKERYPTQARLIEVARTFRKEKFPLDYIVQDWQYWGSDKDGTWSGMIWNPDRYPDPEGMTQAIHDLHMKLMISIWPSVGNDTPLAHELDQYGLRFEPLHWISRKARIYDAFSQKGREIYFKYIKSGLFDKGVDALWMDGTEVEVGTACWNPNEVTRDIKSLGTNAMGDFSRYLNPYTLMTTKGTYEGQRAVNNQRVFTLTRSAWCGAQRYAAASWSGDSFASWDTLKAQMAGGLEVTLSGNPWWTQDIGGFFVNNFPGGEQNPAYRELFARWYQFGAFNPIFRVHGTNIEREPYIFKEMDPEMYQALLDITYLRYRLMPYLYSQSWKVTSEGYTLMRGLPLDFPDDVKARDISDAFMFGPTFLVHPVTRAMYHADNPPPATLSTEFLRTLDGKPGLAVQYFAGENFDTPKDKGVDKTVDHDWPGPPLAGPPGGLDSFEHFSVRWEGTLVVPEDGEYEIGVEGDDGFRLYLDGKKVVEDWSQGAKRYRSAHVTLNKGQEVPLKLEYFQGGVDRVIRLGWRTPSDIRKLNGEKKVLNNVMETYLPSCVNWIDFWTNQQFKGGQTVEKACPLNILPLYVRAGSIVPMGPVMQYATEKPDAPYEIRIYPGADAKFTIYEDDNETYNYEKGERATYDLVWNDAARTLTIGPRKGSFPGMFAERKLNIVMASPDRNTGLAQGNFNDKTVNYTGKAVEVTF